MPPLSWRSREAVANLPRNSRDSGKGNAMSTNTPERAYMKFIIEGRVFNTKTSRVLGVARGVREPLPEEPSGVETVRFEETLYRTEAGALFIHSHRTAKAGRGKPLVWDHVRVVSPQEAVAWAAERQALIADDAELPLPPEA